VQSPEFKTSVPQKKNQEAGYQWLTPVIRATQEAEIRRIEVQNQLEQIVQETLSQKNPSQKRAGRMVQGIDPQYKLWNFEKKIIIFVCN
jgi:hypothetical protein